MNAPDPLSICIASLALFDYSCKYIYAHEEIGIYKDIVKNTSDLISEIKDKLQTPVAGHLPSDDEEWIHSQLQQAEDLLAKANKVTKGMDKLVPKKRLRWMLKKRGVAETYKGAIFQCHATLLHIRSSLIGLQRQRQRQLLRQRYRESASWMEADAPSPLRQIANTAWEVSAVDDSHWSSPHPRLTLPTQGGHHNFYAPSPYRRSSRAAAITGHAIPLALRNRRANTDLHAWLLKNILDRSR